ncbi:MAG: carbamoyltransferase HypF [Acidobacteria bacterium]|nr:carbamoyltransferase HypF [Acidobacteriota bacterium]
MSQIASQAKITVPRSLRLRVVIRGGVQGVGFRPFVYRLATELGLAGWVNNSPQGVFIEVEGDQVELKSFLLRIEREKPPRSFIQSLESSFLDPKGFMGFEIRESDSAGEKTALVLPDIAICPDCLNDISDPNNRRFRYPFTNCTNCGPRFSIIESLPYDRSNTTMKKFTMCAECAAEYENPPDRRFHAQPNACPQCGPHLELWDHEGKILTSQHEALLAAADAIRSGVVVAVKGLGGFHLIVDARNEEAVLKLRQRKHREEKPFALMYPSLDTVKADCEVSEIEERLLLSPESPIILLKRRKRNPQSAIRNPQSIAPGNPYLGAMLPYTPLHHLLLKELRFPIVATSGNLSDEPICFDEHEALDRLSGIADLFLVHNRPITRHVDDSIVRLVGGRELVVRRARGFAPLPIHLDRSLPSMLATGGHLKNTIAVSAGADIFVSQHIGDLETAKAFEAFQQVIYSFKHLYEVEPSSIACDAHPDYLSTLFARLSQLPVHSVQHHFAHVMACMAENEVAAPALGVAWDGTGYGLDGTIWGGEFLRVMDDSFARVAHFRTFRLPGGEKAIKEPRRVAIGLLYEIFGEELFAMNELAPVGSFTAREIDLLRQMLRKKINAPLTSSAGRIFDAVSAIAGVRQITRFEGQGAMELEFALDGVNTDESYPVPLCESAFCADDLIIDWQPLALGIINDVRSGAPTGKISAKFHNTMVESIVAVARRVNEKKVALTGGCFQNKYLTERAVQRLQNEGFRPYWHQRIPPNDGGIALGQLVAAAGTMQYGERQRSEP